MNDPLLHVLTFSYARTPAPAANVTAGVCWIPNPRHHPRIPRPIRHRYPPPEWIFTRHGVAVWFDPLLDVLGPQSPHRRSDQPTSRPAHHHRLSPAGPVLELIAVLDRTPPAGDIPHTE